MMIGGYCMSEINLKDFYPFCEDCIVEVSEEVAAFLYEAERKERSYIRYVFWHEAHYSLDAGDGIEHDALFLPLSPCEIYERRDEIERLYSALEALPDKQHQRVHAYFILGLTKSKIAQMEGVDESAVRRGISRSLCSLRKIF